MPSREEENEVKPLLLANLPSRADKTAFKRVQCEFTRRLHSERSGFNEFQYSVLCSLFSVLCTLFSVLYSLYSVLCTLYSVLCSLFSVLCSLLASPKFTLGSPAFYLFPFQYDICYYRCLVCVGQEGKRRQWLGDVKVCYFAASY